MAEPAADNPLLDLDQPIPFDRIRAEHVEPAVDALLDRSRRALAACLAGEGKERDVLAFLDTFAEPLERAISIVGHLEGVATSPALREAFNAVLPKVTDFHSELMLDARVYAALKDYAASERGRALSGAWARYRDQTLREYRRQGAELDPAGKERIAAIDRELSELTNRFSQNVLDATAAFAITLEDRERLAGLPDRVVEAAAADAEAHGERGWRFSLHAPSLIPVMTYAEDRSLREAMWRAHSRRATEGERDNRPLIRRILALRREKARLLGERDFADYVLAERMARDGRTAADFVADLAAQTRPYWERENEALAAFRRERLGSAAPPMQPWDVAYWAEQLHQERYAFDREELRPYFNLEAVLRGLFELTEKLFGIAVRELPAGDPAFPPVWHESVRAFTLTDADGTRLGTFFADLFPRDEKRGGAWMNPLIGGGPWGEAGYAPGLGLLAANVTPPVGDGPALLSHDEVETIFHEFGHLLHHLVNRVEVRSLAGTNVAWDFVELPSQLMENWCWEREALDMFARHHETGEPIPDDLFGKLSAGRNFRSANAMMRQLSFATLDLELHRSFDPDGDEPVLDFALDVHRRFASVELPADYAMLCGFGHLFAGPVAYAAGYYSYKWAEVLDADVFTRFRDEGIFDRETGRAFVEGVLARGDAVDPMDLFKGFMGREPDPKALLLRSGLTGTGSG